MARASYTTGDLITDFTRGRSGDVLQLHELLSSFSGITSGSHANAFSGGFLQFAHSDGSTLIHVDSDGGGDAFVTLAMLSNTLLGQSDVQNYVL